MSTEKEFFTKLVGLAGMVPHFVLTKEITKLYDQHLAPLGYEQVCKALDRIIVERNSRDPFPSVKEIRSLIQPEVDPESEAVMLASKIVNAIAKIGPYQSKAAAEYLGEVGWAVVECEGGWINICTVLTNDNLGTLKAQWRNLARAFIDRSKLGLPLLTSPKQQKGLTSFSGISINVPRIEEYSEPNRRDQSEDDEETETGNFKKAG